IEAAVHADPALAAIAGQLAIDITPRGLRVQLLDSRRSAMFPAGSAMPNALARRALGLIAPILGKLAGPVRIAGFTDATGGGAGGANWALSAARANAARLVLARAGLADQRVIAVSGHGSHDLLLPADPAAPANRRISILVLRRPEGAVGSRPEGAAGSRPGGVAGSRPGGAAPPAPAAR
ncbi:MAG: OmpA family protein, partial [Rhodospirillales bacterium]|nr:OmpA family protein [Rhodospirillales bacterium]